MGGGGLLAAAAALLVPAAGADTSGPPPEAAIAIVEFPKGARFIGYPRGCSGSIALPEPDDICFVEIYAGPIRIVRHLSGRRLSRNLAVRLNAHARRWPPGTRLLVATLPFQDGNARGEFAIWWDTPEENGAFCREARDLGDPGKDIIARAFERGYQRRAKLRGYIEKTSFRCIRG